MNITSPAFVEGQPIPIRFTCDGEDVSPPLEFGDIPTNTVSLSLIVDDPDSPSGDFTHWLAWNIPPHVSSLGEGSIPSGIVQGVTDFGRPGYGGPCPNKGNHHYQFKLYALDKDLDLSSHTTKTELEKALSGHVLDQATLIGTYQRLSQNQ